MAEALLLNPTFLFRFEIPLRRHSLNWTATGLTLPEECKLPCFGTMGVGPESKLPYAEVRMAWDGGGIGFWLTTSGKTQLPWCRDSRPEDSDGFRLWIDTRDSEGIQRANRYCHQFNFSPMGAGPRRDLPMVDWLLVPRAKENPHQLNSPPRSMKVFGKPIVGGYELSGLIPANALTGYDPEEFKRIRLYYAIVDRELGTQSLTLDSNYYTFENPATWIAANLC